MDYIVMNLSEIHYDWDLVWGYQFHNLLELSLNLSRLEMHQKINHIPGNHAMTSKSFFGITTDSIHVPKAFTNLEDLKVYAAKNPEKKFLIKSKGNRGVQLKNVTEMDFDENDDKGYFAQEFITNPLLFNGHKFDFGIYVVITSIDPLRLYYYNRNMVFRFCYKPYDASNFSDTDTYVISDTKIPVWKFEGTKNYYDENFNTKDAFEAYFRSKGVDVDEIWLKIENAIRSIVISKEFKFIEWVRKFEFSKNIQKFFKIFQKTSKKILEFTKYSKKKLKI
jgi:tubulin monoglycylase TTLL15